MEPFLTLICGKASDDVEHGMNDKAELGRAGKETTHKVKTYLKDLDVLK